MLCDDHFSFIITVYFGNRGRHIMQVSTQWKYDFQWEKKMCRKEKNISQLIASTTTFRVIECEFFEVLYKITF